MSIVREIFVSLLDLSIAGGYVILLVLFLRLLLIRCERKYSFYLWLLVFVSLCVPFRLQAGLSLIPPGLAGYSVQQEIGRLLGEAAGANSGYRTENGVFNAPGTENSEDTAAAGGSPAGAGKAVGGGNGKSAGGAGQEDSVTGGLGELAGTSGTESGNPASGNSSGLLDQRAGSFSVLEQFLNGAAIVWLAGVGVLLSLQAARTLRFHKFLRLHDRDCLEEDFPAAGGRKRGGKATGKAEEIREGRWVTSPFLWGLLHPVIYLPSGLAGAERQYILEHERYHRRRRDNITRLAAFAVTAVYWFHPLVWAAYTFFCRDMEISCDEAVLSGSRKETRRAYASSLLRFAAKQNGYSYTPLTFGEPSVKSRIRNVLTFRKNRLVVSVLVTVLLGAVTLGIFLIPSSGQSGETEDTEMGGEPVTGQLSGDSSGSDGSGESQGTDAAGSEPKDTMVSHAAIGENYLGSFGGLQFYHEDSGNGAWQIYSVDETTGERRQEVLKQTVETGQIQSFGVNEDYFVYSCGEIQGSLGLFSGAFYSFNRQTQRLKEAGVTDAPEFTVIGEYLFYQKYSNQGQDEGNDLYRMDFAFEKEERIAQNTELVGWDEQSGRLLVSRNAGEGNYLPDLVSMESDGSNVIILVDMANGYFADRMEEYDKLVFRNLKIEGGYISFEAWQLGYREENSAQYGYRDSIIEKRFYRVRSDGSDLTESAIGEDSVSLTAGGTVQQSGLDSRISFDSVELLYYEENKSPYLHPIITNQTSKAIAGLQYTMLAYDAEGRPLRLKWNLFSDEKPSYDYQVTDKSEIQPGETCDVRGGWSLAEGPADADQPEQIAYAVYGLQKITFADGSSWSNPGYESWLEVYRGKELPAETLSSYYPYIQEVSERPAVSVQDQEVEVFLTNNTGKELMAGEDYVIQVQEEGEWTTVPGNYIWKDIGIIIGDGSIKQFTCRLDHDGYHFRPGVYRIGKKVFRSGLEKVVYAEFEMI